MDDHHRAACEARYWLRVTGGDRQAVDDLIGRIAARRGQAAADRLREDMRAIYRSSGRASHG